MSDKIGKYYWVRTEAGKEIAFKRNSGAWEMHGIDCKEDLRDLILDVYEEVANGLYKQPEEALAINDVVSSLPSKEEMEIKLDYLIENNPDAFNKYDEITFRFGFRTCFYWLDKKLRK